MQQLTEIRWHARAGQGAVTAAKLVAETALELDQYMQAMPEYGPERMGAPIKAFTRISDEPIEIHCNIENPNVVVVLDESLLSILDVTEGMAEGSSVIVNTCKTPADLRTELKLNDRADVKVCSVDASGISLETLKRDIPNTPMVGALAKVTGLFELTPIIEHLTKTFGKKFTQEVIDANITSVARAYEEVSVG